MCLSFIKWNNLNVLFMDEQFIYSTVFRGLFVQFIYTLNPVLIPNTRVSYYAGWQLKKKDIVYLFRK